MSKQTAFQIGRGRRRPMDPWPPGLCGKSFAEDSCACVTLLRWDDVPLFHQKKLKEGTV